MTDWHWKQPIAEHPEIANYKRWKYVQQWPSINSVCGVAIRHFYLKVSIYGELFLDIVQNFILSCAVFLNLFLVHGKSKIFWRHPYIGKLLQ